MQKAWLLLCPAIALAQADANITVDASAVREPMEISRYALGQGGLSDQPIFDQQVDAIRSLNVKIIRLFVQEYFDLYPKHGVYHWDTLDKAVDTILQTGAKPLMAVAIKPRTLYPVIDQDKVDPTSYAEWEGLIYQMVRHYNVQRKAGIRYWEVFNEPDIGEDGGCPSRFTPENYARYYEHTARAVLRADPKARVGGPALASSGSPLLKGLLDHCSKTKTPLHFVSWHIYNSDPAAIEKTITNVKGLLAQYPDLHCETILDEWNMSLSRPNLEPGYQPSFTIDTISRMREAGLTYSAYYHIRDYHVDAEQFFRFMSREGTLNMANWWNLTPQFDGLFDYQGILRPAYFAFRMLSRLTGNRLDAKSDSTGAKVMAAYDDDQKMIHILAWNFALEAPPASHVNLNINSLAQGKWTLRRIALDSDTASNQENDRMRVRRAETAENVTAMQDSFDLPPYGVVLVSLRKER
ncbi:MAG: glycosyl hydrolase [Bryobacteraceae bacterium]